MWLLLDRLVNMEELIKKLKEYTEFLEKMADKNVVYLHYHGIDFTEEEIATGERLRKEIETLENDKKGTGTN